MTPSDVVRKLAWRARFLADPSRFVHGADGAHLVRHLEEDARHLSWPRRLAFVWPDPDGRPLEELLLLDRVRRAGDGEPYFDLGDVRLFFRPEDGEATDSDLLRGVLTILREAFLQEPHFFNAHVRIRPGDTVLDVGGHIGTSALLFARLTGPRGRVITFEPVHHRVLRRNIEENGVTNVEVVPIGLSDAPGSVEFGVSRKGIDSRVVGSRDIPWPRRRLPVTTIDRFAEERGLERVDFVKLDIEGAEESALRGAADVLRRHRPHLSVASYHTDPEGRPQHPRLVALLRELGYTLEVVPGRHLYAWMP